MSQAPPRSIEAGPWCWAEKAALQRMREGCDDVAYLSDVLSVYLTMCELASDAHDHGRFTETKRLIANNAGVSVRQLYNVQAKLQSLGLLRMATNYIPGTSQQAPCTYTLLAVGNPASDAGTATGAGTACGAVGGTATGAGTAKNGREICREDRKELKESKESTSANRETSGDRIVRDSTSLPLGDEKGKGMNNGTDSAPSGVTATESAPQPPGAEGNSKAAHTSNTGEAVAKKTKKLPTPSREGLAFADWFRELLPSGHNLSSGWREHWARCYDEMLRLDGRTKKQVAAVCEWARSDPFWSGNFLTPAKLRNRKDGVQYFDLFAAKMNPPKKKTQGHLDDEMYRDVTYDH